MSDIQRLKDKLREGSNQTEGHDKFIQGQYYENLTREQYSRNFRTDLKYLSPARDALNPKMNLELLKQRLAQMERIEAQIPAKYRFWPRHLMDKYGAHLNKYKFNYLVKAFLAYNLYREFMNANHLHRVSFLTFSQQMESTTRVATAGALLGASIWLF